MSYRPANVVRSATGAEVKRSAERRKGAEAREIETRRAGTRSGLVRSMKARPAKRDTPSSCGSLNLRRTDPAVIQIGVCGIFTARRLHFH